MAVHGTGRSSREGPIATPATGGIALYIRVLGRFEVCRDERLVIDSSWPRRKAQALIKLLAVNQSRWLHREQVQRAKQHEVGHGANLRKNLHYLRSAFAEHGLPSPVVSTAAEMLALSPEVCLDVDEFKRQVQAAHDSRTDAAPYERALELYTGDLLPQELYEEWTTPLREELRNQHKNVLVELAQLYEAKGEFELAAARLEQLLKTDPLHEWAHRMLMRIYAESGGREKALQQFRECADLLQGELGVEPSEETQALHRRILEGRLQALPPILAPAGNFVGREREIAQLRAAVDDAVSSRGRVVVLAGEPGIGKTRTAEELAVYARLRGAAVRWGRCYEGEGAPAYWPWVQIVRASVAHCDSETLRSDMGAGAAYIAQVVPEVRDALPDLPAAAGLESEQARFRLFDSVALFLKSAARRQPLLVVLEDLHWADKPSLLLLEHLSRELKGVAAIVLCNFRDVEVDRDHPLASTLGELSREHPASRVQLRGLEEPEVARFIEIEGGIEPPASLVAAVYRETEGNPFFAKEIMHLLISEDRLKRAAAHASWNLSIPQSVREVIARRLERISKPCRIVVTVASVIGRDFDLKVLERVPELKDDRVLESLDEAARAHLIEETRHDSRSFRFAHALIREALYDELPITQRVRLHWEVGEAIELAHTADLGLHLAELAHHFFQAAPAGTERKAVEYARRAGDRALAMLAYEEAARAPNAGRQG